MLVCAIKPGKETDKINVMDDRKGTKKPE